MLYPGLFEYKFFRHFVEQCDFQILCAGPQEWAPPATIILRFLRSFALFRSRYVAGGLRRLVALAWRASGGSPFICYWLWTFAVVKVQNGYEPVLTLQSLQTALKGSNDDTGSSERRRYCRRVGCLHTRLLSQR